MKKFKIISITAISLITTYIGIFLNIAFAGDPADALINSNQGNQPDSNQQDALIPNSNQDSNQPDSNQPDIDSNQTNALINSNQPEDSNQSTLVPSNRPDGSILSNPDWVAIKQRMIAFYNSRYGTLLDTKNYSSLSLDMQQLVRHAYFSKGAYSSNFSEELKSRIDAYADAEEKYHIANNHDTNLLNIRKEQIAEIRAENNVLEKSLENVALNNLTRERRIIIWQQIQVNITRNQKLFIDAPVTDLRACTKDEKDIIIRRYKLRYSEASKVIAFIEKYEDDLNANSTQNNNMNIERKKYVSVAEKYRNMNFRDKSLVIAGMTIGVISLGVIGYACYCKIKYT